MAAHWLEPPFFIFSAKQMNRCPPVMNQHLPLRQLRLGCGWSTLMLGSCSWLTYRHFVPTFCRSTPHASPTSPPLTTTGWYFASPQPVVHWLPQVGTVHLPSQSSTDYHRLVLCISPTSPPLTTTGWYCASPQPVVHWLPQVGTVHAVILTVFDPAGNLAYTCPNWQFCVLSDPFGIVTAHMDLKWILAYCLDPVDPVENVQAFVLPCWELCIHSWAIWKFGILFWPNLEILHAFIWNCAYCLDPA